MRRDGIDPHVHLHRGLDERGQPSGRHVAKPGDHVNAGVGAPDLDPVPEIPAEGVEECRAPGGVPRPCSPQVALEVPLADEVGQDLLLERRGVPVGQSLGADEGGDEGLGEDEVAQPQRRKQHLGERADVEDPGPLVESL